MKGSHSVLTYIKWSVLCAAIAMLLSLSMSSQRSVEISDGSDYNVSGPQLYVKALPDSDRMDQSFNIKLELDGVNDLYGYSVDIVYDPSVVAVQGIKPLGAFEGRESIRPVERLDNDKGVLSFVEMLLGPVKGQNGHLSLIELQVKFHSKKATHIKAVYDKEQLNSAAKDLILLVRLVDSQAKPIAYRSMGAYIDAVH